MIEGIHHFGLTVRDVDASAAWYVDVLEFRRVGEFESADGARRKVFLRHDGLSARLGLALDAWAKRLTAAGVVHSSVAPANSVPGAPVIVLRDPDNIQLELFVDPSDASTNDNAP